MKEAMLLYLKFQLPLIYPFHALFRFNARPTASRPGDELRRNFCGPSQGVHVWCISPGCSCGEEVAVGGANVQKLSLRKSTGRLGAVTGGTFLPQTRQPFGP